MSRVFEVTEEQYQTLEEAAKERGMTPESFFHNWVEAVQQHFADEEIDPDQAWFWAPEWQTREHAADAALAAGHFMRYESGQIPHG